MIPLNYQVGEKTIKLNVGDVIKDDSLRASCTVDMIENNIIHVSKVSYSHPYQLTMFALKLFEYLKNALGITNVNLSTHLGSFTVSKNDSEVDLYHRLVRYWR